MFELTKTFRFEASHQLLDHDGKCARLHGHSWVFKLRTTGDYIAATGAKRHMLVDFGRLSEIGKAIVAIFDHQHLNDVLEERHVTSEWLARWIYLYCFGNHGPLITEVEVEETCTSACRYWRTAGVDVMDR